jgi:ectoine hydroxylase-related dioxygenase (phytanoyl-CoA dioxygenase family)
MNFSAKSLLSNELINDHIFNLKSKGYSVINNFFEIETCDLLKLHLDTAINNYESSENSERSKLDKYHMHDLLCKNQIFAKTLEDPRLQQLLSPFISDFWIMYAYTSSSLPPNGDNYGSRIHVDCPRFIPNYITNLGVIWALDDFTEENGATHVLPCSHLVESIPSEEFFIQNNIRLTCNKGALIVFNARLWHSAGKNLTSKFRHALTMNACRPFMKQRMDWVRFIPEQITNSLNGQARRIIGFDTRIPSNLEEFFKPYDQLLYKPGQE